jgi:hypothetical protein
MKKLALAVCTILLLSTCSTQDELETKCSTPATVRDLTGLDGCGWVFELNDGTKLIPLIIGFCGTPPVSKEITENPLYDFEFINGKKVFIDYEPIHVGMVNACMVGETVKITCISEAQIAPPNPEL